jgi:hypothetical protein
MIPIARPIHVGCNPNDVAGLDDKAIESKVTELVHASS